MIHIARQLIHITRQKRKDYHKTKKKKYLPPTCACELLGENFHGLWLANHTVLGNEPNKLQTWDGWFIGIESNKLQGGGGQYTKAMSPHTPQTSATISSVILASTSIIVRERSGRISSISGSYFTHFSRSVSPSFTKLSLGCEMETKHLRNTQKRRQ